MKSVADIRNEFFDNGNKISTESMQDLVWHIENDSLPDRAISLVTDARFMELVPLIEKHLSHDDDFVREIAVGCLVGRLKLPQYAEKALDMAQNEPDGGPRTLAISSLGAVINKVSPALKKDIASTLYNVILNPEYDSVDKRCAFDSILEAMGVPAPQRIAIPYSQDNDLIEKFKGKYEIWVNFKEKIAMKN